MAKKILLADDSPTIRKVVELTFADEGIEVYSVSDGDAAMVTFVRIEPDMLIADVNMPGMNGYRLCEMIKQDETTKHIPVILLVGSFETFDPGEASRVGCDHYFTKPFRSIRELVEKVNECFAPDYGARSLHHDIADIEDLYKSSLEPAADQQRPEDEVLAFASRSDSAEETHFDDGATLEHFLSESTREREAAPAQYPERPRELATTASAASRQISDEDDELLNGFDDAVRPSAGSVETERTSEPVQDDAEEDDVLGIESGGGRSRSADDIVLDVDQARQPAAAERVDDPHMTSVPAEHVRITGDLGRSPWEQPAGDVRREERSAGGSTTSTDILGDAGMDDEIIETSHPSGPPTDNSPETPALAQNAAPIDPFTERVAATADAVMDVVEHAPPVLAPDDATPEQIDTKPSAAQFGAHVTPELIESIVASVLEKMSDRAVRDAAQEAVPRIAEKLIREALTDDDRAKGIESSKD